jgi:hypothetical protein
VRSLNRHKESGQESPPSRQKTSGRKQRGNTAGMKADKIFVRTYGYTSLRGKYLGALCRDLIYQIHLKKDVINHVPTKALVVDYHNVMASPKSTPNYSTKPEGFYNKRAV